MSKVTRMTSVTAVVDTSITRQIKQADLNPVGMIVPSMLTEVQFQALNGTSWVLAYGQSVAGSAYATVTGNSTVPDLRGRAVFGKDDMGGSAINRITAGNSGITGTTLGAAGGNETVAQHNHGPGTLSSGTESVGHIHAIYGANNTNGTSGIGPLASDGHAAGLQAGPPQGAGPTYGYSYTSGSAANVLGNPSVTNSANYLSGANTSHTHAVTSGATASTGTGIGGASGHGNMPPAMIVNYFIKINY